MSQTATIFLAIALWPVISVILYRRLDFVTATTWVVLGAEMFLPEGTGIKLASGIPVLDKTTVASIVLIFASIFLKRRLPSFFKGSALDKAIVCALLVSPIASSIGNTDEVFSGGRLLSGVGLYDGFSAAFSQLMFVTPFFVAREFFNEERAFEKVLAAFVFASALYSLPILYEVRFSPQLHAMLYGYFPSSFITEFRYGGYRPVVFMPNGLTVAVFMAVGVVAAAVFWTQGRRVLRLPAGVVVLSLGFIVVLCKTLAALVYATIFISVVRFCRPRKQAAIAAGLGLIVLAYPTLRSAGYFPTSALVALSSYLDKDRSLSLNFRFDQEDKLLDRARERVFFGWGRYGRNRVYDEYGADPSITDGRWIIQLGQYGLFGFVAEFGLLALVILRSSTALRRATTTKESSFIGGGACILTLCFVDQIPNASLSSWTWLIAGGLAAQTAVILRQPLQRRAPSAPQSFSTVEN